MACTIFLVEDEVFIGLDIQQRLEDLGCTVVGPFERLTTAIQNASSQTFDGAILDVNIKGGLVFPVAEILWHRKVPIIFSTGYQNTVFPEKFKPSAEVLHKPFNGGKFECLIRRLFLKETTNA